MMELALFGKGLLLGLAIAMPLGPIGALCISRTLERGFWAGMAGGLGTALADGFYALAAAAGFVAASGALGRLDLPLRLVGGLFLLWLAWRSFRVTPAPRAAQIAARDLLGTVAATFGLTLANPATILSFAAIFAGLGLAGTPGLSAVPLVAGVFLGSLGWWAVLSGGVALARRRLPAGFARRVSWVSGVMLAGFGLWALGPALM